MAKSELERRLSEVSRAVKRAGYLAERSGNAICVLEKRQPIEVKTFFGTRKKSRPYLILGYITLSSQGAQADMYAGDIGFTLREPGYRQNVEALFRLIEGQNQPCSAQAYEEEIERPRTQLDTFIPGLGSIYKLNIAQDKNRPPKRT